MGERTRIARDLHDTLLQSFQGFLFEFQAARNLFSRRPEDAMRTLDDAIGSAKAAITEGRDAIKISAQGRQSTLTWRSCLRPPERNFRRLRIRTSTAPFSV